MTIEVEQRWRVTGFSNTNGSLSSAKNYFAFIFNALPKCKKANIWVWFLSLNGI